MEMAERGAAGGIMRPGVRTVPGGAEATQLRGVGAVQADEVDELEAELAHILPKIAGLNQEKVDGMTFVVIDEPGKAHGGGNYKFAVATAEDARLLFGAKSPQQAHEIKKQNHMISWSWKPVEVENYFAYGQLVGNNIMKLLGLNTNPAFYKAMPFPERGPNGQLTGKFVLVPGFLRPNASAKGDPISSDPRQWSREQTEAVMAYGVLAAILGDRDGGTYNFPMVKLKHGGATTYDYDLDNAGLWFSTKQSRWDASRENDKIPTYPRAQNLLFMRYVQNDKDIKTIPWEARAEMLERIRIRLDPELAAKAGVRPITRAVWDEAWKPLTDAVFDRQTGVALDPETRLPSERGFGGFPHKTRQEFLDAAWEVLTTLQASEAQLKAEVEAERKGREGFGGNLRYEIANPSAKVKDGGNLAGLLMVRKIRPKSNVSSQAAAKRKLEERYHVSMDLGDVKGVRGPLLGGPIPIAAPRAQIAQPQQVQPAQQQQQQ
jgi:hypothetical protein